jgi:hypothetical protein
MLCKGMSVSLVAVRVKLKLQGAVFVSAMVNDMLVIVWFSGVD